MKSFDILLIWDCNIICNRFLFLNSNIVVTILSNKTIKMKKINFVRSAIAMTGICFVMFLPSAFAQKNPTLSDAEVASVAVVANQIDIDYAEIAKKRSKNAEVLKFSETMKNDHTAVIGQAAALVQRLGV